MRATGILVDCRVHPTMVSHVVIVAALLPVFYFFSLYRRFQKNLRAAKASGIPYVVLPVYVLSRFWIITSPLWLPAVKMLPDSWTKNRVEWVQRQAYLTLPRLPRRNSMLVTNVGLQVS
jgi:hypothetical protein